MRTAAFVASTFLLVAAILAVGVLGGLASDCVGTVGLASWYGTESGTRTANGEVFTGQEMTAAMPSRKHLGEHWRVTYRGKSVVVRINDIGPAKRLHRIIDLSRAAAERIGLIHAGVGKVCVERLQ